MKSVSNYIISLLMLATTVSLNAQLDDCDFNCGTFTEKAYISYRITKGSLASFDGKIYALGATDFWWDPIMRTVTYDTLYVYDPATDSWNNDHAPIPVPRHCEGENLVIDGNWYFPGGTVFLSTENGNNFHPAPLSRHDVYDPVNDRWELRASLPFPLNSQGAVAGGKIYMTGGIKEDIAPHGNVFMYDPEMDLWTQKSDMNIVRFFHYVVAAAGKIYAIGGNRVYGDYTETMNFNGEVYDPDKDQWTFIADPPDSLGVEGGGCAVVEDEIYIFGGCTIMLPNPVVTRNIFKYVPGSDQWIYVGQMPASWTYFSAIAIGRTIYILGGWNGAREVGTVPINNLTELKLDDITLDSVPRLNRLITGNTETIDLSAYFRHIHGEVMTYRLCMDPQFEDEVTTAIDGETLTITTNAIGYAELRVLAEEGENRMGFDLKLDVVTGMEQTMAGWNPKLEVYPNPSNGNITILFNLATPEEVQLEIVDLSGREMASFPSENRRAGAHKITWNTSEVKSGIYICNLTSPGKRAVEMIVVE